MSGEVKDKGGVADERARSGSAVQSGKCSSILEYLDHVSDDARVYDKAAVPRVPDMFGAGASSSSSLSSSSSATSCPRQTRYSRPSQLNGGEEAKLDQREHRAPWDNSIKHLNKAAAATASRTRHDRRGAHTTDAGWKSLSSATSRTRRDRRALSRTAAAAVAAGNSPTSRSHGEGTNLRGSGTAADSDTPSFSDASRTANGSRNIGGFEQTLGLSSFTAGKEEAPTTTVGAMVQQRPRRRWVWDEWGDDVNVGDSSPPLRDSSERHGLAKLANRSSSGSRRSSSGPARPPPCGAAAAVELSSARDEKRESLEDDDACTPAARQAFEDVQATARSMKAILKEKRSEVGARIAAVRWMSLCTL